MLVNPSRNAFGKTIKNTATALREAEPMRGDVSLESGFGHQKHDEIIGEEASGKLFPKHGGRLDIKVSHVKGGFNVTEVNFDAPTLGIKLNEVKGGVGEFVG